MRAYNRAGDGPWSSPLEVISGAGPPDKPRDPKAVCKSGTAVNISWDQPINNGAIITGYKLELAQVSLTYRTNYMKIQWICLLRNDISHHIY